MSKIMTAEEWLKKKAMDKNGKIITELTPQHSEKIFKSIMQKRYNEKVSKEAVLHHLKQLKAQMGKAIKAECGFNASYTNGIESCMKMIDNKIAKIKSK